MKYIKPTYKNETVETKDIVLASLGEGVSLVEKDESSAQVSASVLDILGLVR